MLLQIRYEKGRKLSDAIQSRLEEKLEPISRNLEEDHPVHVIIKKHKNGDVAEINFHYRGHDLFAKEDCKTLFEAIDSACDHVHRQFKKILDKMKKHKGDRGLKDLEILPMDSPEERP